METGLYIITAPSGNFYIGSTSRTFKRRWEEHRTELRHHKHKNSVLQAAWDKYGEVAMVFEILYECTVDECEYYEQIALDVLAPAYNLSLDVSSPFRNRKHTQAAKDKCSLIWLGKKKPPFSAEHRKNLGLANKGKTRDFSEAHCNNMRVSQIERWKNPTEKMLNKKHPSGYIHKNPRSIAHCEAIKTSLIGKGKLGDKNPAARSVKCIETGKVFTTTKYAIEWVKNKIKNPKASRCNISSCCTGKLKSAYGYHWEYADKK